MPLMLALSQATLNHAWSRSVADVSKTFKQVNIRKATGPDGIPGRVLRACTDSELASEWMLLFEYEYEYSFFEDQIIIGLLKIIF
jgi:hypothetical protein